MEPWVLKVTPSFYYLMPRFGGNRVKQPGWRDLAVGYIYTREEEKEEERPIGDECIRYNIYILMMR